MFHYIGYNQFKFVNTLRFFKKGAYYSAIQIYNKLPDYIKLLGFEHKCSSFKNSLKIPINSKLLEYG